MEKCRLFLLMLVSFSVAHGAVFLSAEMGPGKAPDTAALATKVSFSPNEKAVRVFLRAYVLEPQADPTNPYRTDYIYKPIFGTDKSNSDQAGWYYWLESIDRGRPAATYETKRQLHIIPLSSLNLPPQKPAYQIRIVLQYQTDGQGPWQIEKVSDGGLSIEQNNLRTYFVIDPQIDTLLRRYPLNSTLLVPYKADPREDDRLDAGIYHQDPFPAKNTTEQERFLEKLLRSQSLAKRPKNPLDELVGPQTELIYFITNHATLPVTDPAKPWDTFRAGSQEHDLLHTVHAGAVLLDMPTGRARGSIGKISLKSLLGEEYPLSSGTPEARKAASNFPYHIWGRDVLIYIHGFNNSFEDSMRQAAQLKADLHFKGPVIAYSWASKAKTTGYHDDAKAARQSLEQLSNVLMFFLNEKHGDPRFDCPPGKVHVIAHSMGNWLFLNSVGLLNLRHELYENSFGTVILASPDVSTLSIPGLASVIAKGSNRVSLYYSSKDLALHVSRFIHGAPRAGQQSSDTVGLDSIDVDNVNDLWIRQGHSAYAVSKEVLDDITSQLSQNLNPEVRGLSSKTDLSERALKDAQRQLNDFGPDSKLYRDWDWEFPRRR